MKIEQDMGTFNSNKKPKNKMTMAISILIAITVVIVIVIIAVMFSMKDESLVLTIDGQKVSYTSDTFLFEENSGEVYISIKDIAPLVGYEAHNRRI